MDKPKIDTATVYGKVANLLPLEGRDFTLDSTYDENKKAVLIITPLTAIGSAWVPFLQKELEKPLEKSGVTVTTGGVAAREVETVATIRTRIENEANAARAARLKAAQEAHAKAETEAQAARKARIAASGEQAPASPDEVAAVRAVGSAALAETRLKSIATKLATIRGEIDEAATQAAREDEKKGKSWAVDMNAPLTSLFDRQDVTNKFKSKEDLLDRLAAKTAELEEIRLNAIMTAKQYIIQK